MSPNNCATSFKVTSSPLQFWRVWGLLPGERRACRPSIGPAIAHQRDSYRGDRPVKGQSMHTHCRVLSTQRAETLSPRELLCLGTRAGGTHCRVCLHQWQPNQKDCGFWDNWSQSRRDWTCDIPEGVSRTTKLQFLSHTVNANRDCSPLSLKRTYQSVPPYRWAPISACLSLHIRHQVSQKHLPGVPCSGTLMHTYIWGYHNTVHSRTLSLIGYCRITMRIPSLML